MSSTTMRPQMSVDADYAMYRSISGMAVVGLVFTLFGMAAILTPWLVVLPVLGVIFSMRGLSAIRARPEELTGRGMAWCGLVLGTIVAVGSVGWHGYVYATEVPDGYLRVGFNELQLARNPRDNHPLLPIPNRALELDGKEIFIKGYVYPDGRTEGIQHFILVPDMGTCCFGGDPKLTDMIEVKLKDPHTVDYSYARRSLAGVFRLNRQPSEFLGKVAIYQLDAEVVR